MVRVDTDRPHARARIEICHASQTAIPLPTALTRGRELKLIPFVVLTAKPPTALTRGRELKFVCIDHA